MPLAGSRTYRKQAPDPTTAQVALSASGVVTPSRSSATDTANAAEVSWTVTESFRVPAKRYRLTNRSAWRADPQSASEIVPATAAGIEGRTVMAQGCTRNRTGTSSCGASGPSDVNRRVSVCSPSASPAGSNVTEKLPGAAPVVPLSASQGLPRCARTL